MTTYEATIPEEPPRGTVLLDKHGTAWQRINLKADYPRWVAAKIDQSFDRNNVRFWPQLLNDYGPLLELCRPEQGSCEENT